MERTEKSLGMAYLLWVLVGIWGGHRFYMERQPSAMLIVALHLGGWILVIASPRIGEIWATWAGLMMVSGALAWVLVDAIFLPGMVDSWNARKEQDLGPYMPGAFSPDPGFQATLSKAGADGPAHSGKRSIPEGYELPWRSKDGGSPGRA